MQVYIRRNGEQRGPFDLLAVQQGIEAGIILPTDSAWYEGAADWMPVSELHATRINVAEAPPPIPPVVPTPVAAVPAHNSLAPNFQPTQIGCTTMLAAIIVVFVVGILGSMVLAAMGAETVANIVFASLCFGSIGWVFFDAMALKTGRGQVAGMVDMAPWAWALCFILAWLIAFPIYLVTRPEIIKVNNQYPDGIPTSTGHAAKTNSGAAIAVGCLVAVVVLFIAIAVLTYIGKQLSEMTQENVAPVPQQSF